MVASLLERASDTLVSVWDPRRAYLRGHFRRMRRDDQYRDGVLAALRAMGYKAGTTGKNETPWSAAWGARSADAELLQTLEPMRNKSRELKRDDAVASGLLKGIPREVVGTGLVPQSLASEETIRDVCNEVFQERFGDLFPGDDVDLYEQQLMVAAKLCEDGEIWVHEAKTNPTEPLWFENVEADRVDTPLDAKPADPEGQIRAGVERDGLGRVVAYWVAKAHPGDTPVGFVAGKMPTIVPRSVSHYQRIPKASCKHVKITDRPGQTRGAPLLHAVIQDLRDLDLLMLAVMKRFQISASLAVFLESDESLGDIFDATAKEYGFQLDQDITPGMIFKLMPGEKVSTLTPNFPVPDLEKLVILLARRIGAAIGVSYQTVLNDFSGSNYSSARTDLLRDRRLYRYLQHKLVTGYLKWLWVSVLEDAKLLGDPRLRAVTPADIGQVGFVGNGWEWVDPESQAKAVQIQLDIGLTSLADEAAKLGKDWRKLQDQRIAELKRWKERLEEEGLTGGEASPQGSLLSLNPQEAAA